MAERTAYAEKLLEIKDLRLVFHTYNGNVQALRGVDLVVNKGETVGLVGESGCGKSQTALACLRLTPSPPADYTHGEIRYFRRTKEDQRKRAWTDILKLSEPEMRSIRGNDISIIFQEPMTRLNPVLRVGDQITEVIVNHQDVGVKLNPFDRWWLRRGFTTWRYKRAMRAAAPRAIEMLRSIGIPDPDKVMRRYPHELSGGMRQRIMIAIALSCDPDLLIADEPTTALDVTIQAQIMDLMRDLKTRTGASILLITHHLGVVAEMSDRIAVMYAGRIVEDGPAPAVFGAPKHPYTLGLLNSIPDIRGRSRDDDLSIIPGAVPNMIDPPAGCAYHPRCPFAFDRCRAKVPELQPAGDDGSTVACHLYDSDVEMPEALKNKDASVYKFDPRTQTMDAGLNPTTHLSEVEGQEEGRA